jgi:hypothetical protein
MGTIGVGATPGVAVRLSHAGSVAIVVPVTSVVLVTDRVGGVVAGKVAVEKMKKELVAIRAPSGALNDVIQQLGNLRDNWHMRGYWKLEIRLRTNAMDQVQYVLYGEKRPEI